MGRLTLNVLLSFAQFEREVIGERIRDKIAASKRRGMWMGGVVPLGYRAQAASRRARASVSPMCDDPKMHVLATTSKQKVVNRAQIWSKTATSIDNVPPVESVRDRECGGVGSLLAITHAD